MPELEFLVDHVVKYIIIAMLLILTLLASISIMWVLGGLGRHDAECKSTSAEPSKTTALER